MRAILIWKFAVLPSYHDDGIPSAFPAAEVTKTAIRLRYLINECVPCELEEDKITQAHSKIITDKVVKAAREAGGNEYAACVVWSSETSIQWQTTYGIRFTVYWSIRDGSRSKL